MKKEEIYSVSHKGLKAVKTISKTTKNSHWIHAQISKESVKKYGAKYNIHPLLQEDILSKRQRPKIEFHKKFIFMVLYVLFFDGKKLQKEPMSIVLTKDTIITFTTRQYDFIDIIRKDMQASKSKHTDYLAYLIVDNVVDNYFDILAKIGNKIEKIEDEVLDNPDKKTLIDLHEAKHKLIFFRRTLWPTREIVNSLQRTQSGFVREKHKIYFRDIYEHLVELVDTIETHRDIVSGLVDTYLSNISNRMNEIMKVLTVFASVFIPLTFLTGVYGMNFEYMPELHIPYAYPLFWVVSIGVLVFTVWFFKKKQWF